MNMFNRKLIWWVVVAMVSMLEGCMEYHGTVVDERGNPVEGAKLKVTDVMGNEWITSTNSDGYYFVDNLSDYGHDILVSKSGYIQQIHDSQVNVFSEINFVLPHKEKDNTTPQTEVKIQVPISAAGKVTQVRQKMMDGV